MVEDLGRMHSLEYIGDLIQGFTHMLDLHLNTEEKCILCSVSILSAGGRCEAWLAGSANCYNFAKNIVTLPSLGTINLDDMRRYKDYSDGFFHHRTRVLISIQSLMLKYEEMVLLRCLIVLSPGSRTESWQILSHQTFNTSKQLFTSPEGMTVHTDAIKSCMFSEELVNKKAEVTTTLRNMHLNRAEILLLCSIPILAAASRVETWHIWHHPAINLEKQLVTPPDGKTTHIDTLKSLCWSEEIVDTKLALVEAIRNLHLEYEEMVLLGSLTIVAADRCALKEPAKVEESQWLLLEALDYLLKKNHPDDKHLLAKCILVLTELRTVSALHAKEEEKFTMDWSDKIEFPPLFYEIWST